MRALIIEDEPLIAMLIEDCLRMRGYTTIEFAATEAEALAVAATCCPDLITSDVRLAEGCGIDAVEMICREKPIPTLFITGTAQDAQARVLSAVVLSKPFNATTLNRALERVAGAQPGAV